MAPENKGQTAKQVAEAQFTIVRKGKSAAAPTDAIKPTEDMLDSVPDGTVVAGSDGVQWIAMAAVPRRWERAKRQIATSAVQNS